MSIDLIKGPFQKQRPHCHVVARQTTRFLLVCPIAQFPDLDPSSFFKPVHERAYVVVKANASNPILQSMDTADAFISSNDFSPWGSCSPPGALSKRESALLSPIFFAVVRLVRAVRAHIHGGPDGRHPRESEIEAHPVYPYLPFVLG